MTMLVTVGEFELVEILQQAPIVLEGHPGDVLQHPAELLLARALSGQDTGTTTCHILQHYSYSFIAAQLRTQHSRM